MTIDESAIANDSFRIEGLVTPRVIDLRESGPQSEKHIPGVAPSATQAFRQLGLWLGALDVLCLITSLVVAHTIRFGATPGLGYLSGIALACCVWIAVFSASGLYSPHRLSPFEEMRRTVPAAGLGIVIIVSLTFWQQAYISQSWIALTAVIAISLELVMRRIVRAYVVRLQESGALALKTLVIGSGNEATQLLKHLDAPGSGFVPVGQIDSSNRLLNDAAVGRSQRVERLRIAIREYQPECIFIASATMDPAEMVSVTTAARLEDAEVRINTHVSNVLTSRLSIQDRGEAGLTLSIKPIRMSSTSAFVKRAMDLVIATSVAMAALPVMAVIAVVVRLTSPGPALFVQKRVTRGGRPFHMYKFRTMEVAKDEEREHPQLDTSAAFFKMKDDPRLTSVGRILRKLSLDELPQLLNVIRGDMSLVGPRPLPVEQVSANADLLGPRHEVRAGCTGWWQIQGRSDVGPDQAVNMDLFYIENWSPALDFYILFRTVAVLTGMKGAY